MKIIVFMFLGFIFLFSTSHADCNDAATKQISSNGDITESDRNRLIKECEDYNRFRAKIKTDPSGAYVLSSNSFTCRDREDYVEIYNAIIDQGGEYNTQFVDRFKSCGVLKNQTLVKIVKKKAGDPVVQVRYPDEWVPDYLYTKWVHINVLKPYGTIVKHKIK